MKLDLSKNVINHDGIKVTSCQFYPKTVKFIKVFVGPSTFTTIIYCYRSFRPKTIIPVYFCRKLYLLIYICCRKVGFIYLAH